MKPCSGMCRSASIFVAACLAALSGCGANFDEILYQTASATGRTLIDAWLVDYANALADSFDLGGTQMPGDGLDNGGGDGDPALSDGPPLEELIGVPEAGEEIFGANSCAACHCADAGGGCALEAPSLVTVETVTLDDRLRGDADHPGGKFDLADQDVVDLQAYLSSLGAGDG